MDLFQPAQMRELLARHDFHFSKSKGQNFLTAAWVPDRIADGAGLDKGCGVVEIGPGVGALTQALCRRAGKVVAVELDRRLEPVLAETLADADNLTLLFGDALRLDLCALVRGHLAGLRPVACANLPYYITTPVLAKLLESGCFSSVTVMMQKEVAQRICAAPGTADYGAFSVFCTWYAEPRPLFDVPPSCFVPQPKVTSSVVRLDLRTQPVCEVASEALFFRVVKAGFAQRRKTLTNCLAAAFAPLDKAALAQLLRGCGFDPSIRAETLDVPGFARITNELYRRLPV